MEGMPRSFITETVVDSTEFIRGAFDFVHWNECTTIGLLKEEI